MKITKTLLKQTVKLHAVKSSTDNTSHCTIMKCRKSPCRYHQTTYPK